MEAIRNLWSGVLQYVSMIHVVDILDILIVAFIVYKLLMMIRSTSAMQIVKAIVIVFLISYISGLLGLNALNYIASRAIEVGFLALIIVFQPELRRALERLGSNNLKYLVIPKVSTGEGEKTIEQTVAACRTLARQKIGALIVFERENSLEEYFKTGTIVDAQVSAELLKNIFFPKAALHDGAVVVRGDRIAAAGCVLPLTENPDLSRDLGTRHRAAIGMSEHSDAVIVVVSEETGVISCAVNGMLKRYLAPETLQKLLVAELVEDAPKPIHQRVREYLRKLTGKGEGDDHEEK